MTYKIIGDSCLDLTDELKKMPVFRWCRSRCR